MHSENLELYKIILVGVSVLTAVLAYFIISIIRQQRRVYKWQQERIAAEITTLENERKRIAADLHDELGPVLSAVKLQVNHLEPNDEIEKVVLEKSSRQIDEVIRRFREISYDLLPNTLVRKGLVKAAEEFTGRMSESSGLKITFCSDPIRLSGEQEVNLYRILQEIVHNTVKHSRASELRIEFKKRPGALLFETNDNGIGFNYAEKGATGGGLGLLSLQSRVEVMQGNLAVVTAPGKGTSFSIQIPVPAW